MRHLKQLKASHLQPGIRLNFAKKDVCAAWPDQFKSYEVQGCKLTAGKFNGTLIRAPLRRPEAESDISNHCVGEAGLRDMTELIRLEGYLWLIFLKSVTCIEVQDLESGDFLCRHVRLKEPGSEIQIRTDQEQKGDFEQRRYELQSDGEVSVAVPLCVSAKSDEGRVFSRLPLNIKAGMAAHVSALFWTSADRRSVVLDVDKDLQGWARQNRDYLQRIACCLATCVANRAAQAREVPIELFPRGEKPSETAELLHAMFYQEIVRRCRDSDAGVLYNVAGLEVKAPMILLTAQDVPQALQLLQAPVVLVNAEVLQSLKQLDAKLFLELSPKTLRAWLRSMPGELDRHCDKEILRFCLRDEARGAAGQVAEDLAGCPLLFTADSQVRRFAHDAYKGQTTLKILCCASKEEWDLAQHFPRDSVFPCTPESAQVLFHHPQICKLTVESVAALGQEACGQEFAAAFWRWFDPLSAQQPEVRLPDPPGKQHPLDHLRVLPVLMQAGCELFPLVERKRGLWRSADPELSRGLEACGVLLVSQESSCPRIVPDSVARAVHHATSATTEPLEPSRASAQAWRAVLQQLARSDLSEAARAARRLPAFRSWDGQASYPDKRLFPAHASRMLHEALQHIKLDVLKEEDMNILALLRKMKVPEVPLEQVARDALCQTQDIKLVALLIREGLGNVLRGEPVLPVQGGSCLPPESCLLWDGEGEFEVVPRRISSSASEQLRGLQGKLAELGCRRELDEVDVLDIARQVEQRSDADLAERLLERLDNHPDWQKICQSPDLQPVRWLSVRHPGAERSVMAPASRPWQQSAEQLVGRVRPLVAAKATAARLLGALGVPGPEDVDDAVLSEQLQALASKARAEDVTPIYQKLRRPPTLEKWVWTKSGFQPLEQVSKDGRVLGLCPAFHFLQEQWHDLPVFQGVNLRLTPKEIFHAMASEPPVHEVHMTAIKLLTDLASDCGDNTLLAKLAQECGCEVRVPTKACKLVPVQQAFFHDMKWNGEGLPSDLEEVHGDVSKSACKCFGVRNLSEILAQECSCGEGDWLEVTGQHEPLTRRLKNILKDYPWQALVKEMLQNAEDAGASKFKILIDRRPRGKESLLTPQMADQQGPCLWFYNDAVFEEKDFQALVSLGQGSKAGEKGKIGRHGLGFNSIFNITDLPSVLSSEPGTQFFCSQATGKLAVVSTCASTCVG